LVSHYHIRPFVPADRSSLGDLYRSIYGEAWRSKTNFAWSIDNSFAAGGAAVAVTGDAIVSAQAYCDFPLHTPWGTRRGTLLLDAATHPAHQRRGLFRRVVDAATAAAFDRDTLIVMTTPNRFAARGFQNMRAWQRLCSLECLALPLSLSKHARGDRLLSVATRLALSAASLFRRRRSAIVPSSPPWHGGVESPWDPGSEADELWRRAARQGGIMAARDRGFLRWRFGEDYRLFLARDGRAPVAYAAARVVSWAGLKMGMLVDCVTAGDGASAARLLASVVNWMEEQDASAALGYFLPQSAAWHYAREAGFLRLARALAPRDYPVYVSVRPEGPYRPQILNVSRWHLSLADSDLV
jgi:hypothetical protein